MDIALVKYCNNETIKQVYKWPQKRKVRVRGWEHNTIIRSCKYSSNIPLRKVSSWWVLWCLCLYGSNCFFEVFLKKWGDPVWFWWGDTMNNREWGSGVSVLDACEDWSKGNALPSFLTAYLLSYCWLHIIWVAVILMLKKGVKSHKHLSKRITILSLKEPLLIASTSPLLSHFNSLYFLPTGVPHHYL